MVAPPYVACRRFSPLVRCYKRLIRGITPRRLNLTSSHFEVRDRSAWGTCSASEWSYGPGGWAGSLTSSAGRHAAAWSALGCSPQPPDRMPTGSGCWPPYPAYGPRVNDVNGQADVAFRFPFTTALPRSSDAHPPARAPATVQEEPSRPAPAGVFHSEANTPAIGNRPATNPATG